MLLLLFLLLSRCQSHRERLHHGDEVSKDGFVQEVSQNVRGLVCRSLLGTLLVYPDFRVRH